ncbi:natterin-4-like [Topomyia yanbarensis]|uniref:natterin-4-like n=1 Tax=Topomyia yanbarensis TaxID=2498891 RepID=UPI00273C2FFD|nr:natterin-4-like [Topomyia yanbarensis]
MPQLTQPPPEETKPPSSPSSSSSAEDDGLNSCSIAPRFPFHDDLIGGCWQHCTVDGPFPSNMVRAGVDGDGAVIFAGRAFHEGEMVPAKVIPSKNAAYICYGGEEILKEDFEVLRSGDFVWEFASNGVVPENAVKIGATVDGEPLYMGRALYSGTQTPGKVHSSHACLYIPFDGAEVSCAEYEVLCLK